MQLLYLNIILRFILVLSLQIIFFNHLPLGSWAFSHFYLLNILLLPVQMNSLLTLLTGFFLGISVDFSEGTLGLFTATCLFSAYFRIKLLKWMKPYDGYLPDEIPTFITRGWSWWLNFFLILTITHILFFNLLQGFQNFSWTWFLGNTIFSTIYTFFTILMFMFMMLLFSNKK